MWTLVACGRVADGARDELARRLSELLTEPRFGTDHTQLVVGSGPPVAGLHAADGERSLGSATA